MSAPLAGKFQDHYKVLDINPKSNMEAIQQAYGKLAEKYDPRNAKTGDQAKFDAINLAYEVLSDPGLRAEFDKIKSGGEEKAEFTFSGLDFFGALGHETALRAALLCVLYDRRRLKPFTPGLSMRRVENMLETTAEGLSFALWYLKQRNLVTSDDKSNLLITAEGMDYLEMNPPTPDDGDAAHPGDRVIDSPRTRIQNDGRARVDGHGPGQRKADLRSARALLIFRRNRAIERQRTGAANQDGDDQRDRQKVILVAFPHLTTLPIHKEVGVQVIRERGYEHHHQYSACRDAAEQAQKQPEGAEDFGGHRQNCQGRGNAHGLLENLDGSGNAPAPEEAEHFLRAVGEEDYGEDDPGERERRIVGGGQQFLKHFGARASWGATIS